MLGTPTGVEIQGETVEDDDVTEEDLEDLDVEDTVDSETSDLPEPGLSVEAKPLTPEEVSVMLNEKKGSENLAEELSEPEPAQWTGGYQDYDSLTRELKFPGFQGLPFKGTPPDLKNEDAPRRLPITNGRVYVRIFDLSKTRELSEYEKIMSKFVGDRSHSLLSHEEFMQMPDKGTWKTLIRWVELYTELPEER